MLSVQIDTMKQYWKDVLKRAVEVIDLLPSRELVFFRNRDVIDSTENGNFYPSLIHWSQTHLERYANKRRGKVSYLSYTIGDLIAELLSQQQVNAIVYEIKEAKHYSASIDSTPDISHSD